MLISDPAAVFSHYGISYTLYRRIARPLERSGSSVWWFGTRGKWNVWTSLFGPHGDSEGGRGRPLSAATLLIFATLVVRVVDDGRLPSSWRATLLRRPCDSLQSLCVNIALVAVAADLIAR